MIWSDKVMTKFEKCTKLFSSNTSETWRLSDVSPQWKIPKQKVR